MAVNEALTECPECCEVAVTHTAGPLPVCLSCDWTGWPPGEPVIATPHSQALWILSGQGVPPTEAEDYADAERDIRRI